MASTEQFWLAGIVSAYVLAAVFYYAAKFRLRRRYLILIYVLSWVLLALGIRGVPIFLTGFVFAWVYTDFLIADMLVSVRSGEASYRVEEIGHEQYMMVQNGTVRKSIDDDVTLDS